MCLLNYGRFEIGGVWKLKCTVHCSGTFRVIANDGRDMTPTSQKSCAILAVLATSADMTTSRATLQNLFWAGSSAIHASGSLRSALHVVRHASDGAFANTIIGHKHHISLDPQAWDVAIDADRQTFMEGFDLKSLKGNSEAFEDWLRDMRMEQSGVDQWAEGGSVPPPVSSEENIAICIVPVERNSVPQARVTSADHLIDQLMSALALRSMVTLYDLRGTALCEGALSPEVTRVHAFILKTTVFRSAGSYFLRPSLLEARTGRIAKIFQPLQLEGGQVEHEVIYAAEQILDALHTCYSEAPTVNLLPWTVLSSLFSMDARALSTTEAEIDRLLEATGMAMLNCLKIFLQIFKENEGLASPAAPDIRELERALSGVPTGDPLRPLCESVIGYAAHMLCAENDMSQFLLNTADKRAPGFALNLDHLAVLNLSNGNIAAAKAAHRRCMQVSELSSWRYSYDITGAMIALAEGDFHSALRHSNNSLLQRPRFVGALRYSMIGFAMNRSEENANLMKRRIMQLRPDYDLSHWAEGFLRRSDPKFGNNVALTLREYDMI